MIDPLVLFAEDDNEDWMLVQDAFEGCPLPHIERVKDGEELLERLQDSTQALPHVIMLDLKMPRMDGPEVLEVIKNDPRFKHIPIIVMTTSKLESDIVRSYTAGASSYVVKPVTFEAMRKAMSDLHYYWTQVVEVPRCNEGVS